MRETMHTSKMRKPEAVVNGHLYVSGPAASSISRTRSSTPSSTPGRKASQSVLGDTDVPPVPSVSSALRAEAGLKGSGLGSGANSLEAVGTGIMRRKSMLPKSRRVESLSENMQNEQANGGASDNEVSGSSAANLERRSRFNIECTPIAASEHQRAHGRTRRRDREDFVTTSGSTGHTRDRIGRLAIAPAASIRDQYKRQPTVELVFRVGGFVETCCNRRSRTTSEKAVDIVSKHHGGRGLSWFTAKASEIWAFLGCTRNVDTQIFQVYDIMRTLVLMGSFIMIWEWYNVRCVRVVSVLFYA